MRQVAPDRPVRFARAAVPQMVHTDREWPGWTCPSAARWCDAMGYCHSDSVFGAAVVSAATSHLAAPSWSGFGEQALGDRVGLWSLRRLRLGAGGEPFDGGAKPGDRLGEHEVVV